MPRRHLPDLRRGGSELRGGQLVLQWTVRRYHLRTVPFERAAVLDRLRVLQQSL